LIAVICPSRILIAVISSARRAGRRIRRGRILEASRSGRPPASMQKKNLKLRVTLYLLIALSPAMVVFPFFIVRHQQQQLQEEISRHVSQMAELIVKSTRQTMLANEREIVEQMILDIGRQPGIERVRVLNKDGTIIHSNRPGEVGYSLEQRDPPCVHCHTSSQPLEHAPDEARWRVYTDAGGKRVLGAMEPIRNEPSCSSASCHEHRAGQKVLGIVDIAYSLDEVDHALQRHGLFLAAISLGVILIVAASVGVLLQRLIYLPLKDLETGARRLAEGDIEHTIPVRGDDEFGRVAGSFNHMTAALKSTMAELQEMVQTLESKVEQRTRELRAAEAEVAQNEKLAAVGQLASGIAHELNNPLTGVLTFTSLVRRKLPDGNPDAEDLDLVIRETKRCASIIRRLLDFAREKVPSKGWFALNRVVEDTVRLVARQATLADVDIETRLDPELPQVWGDADLIKQVVLNILVNATQAIEGAGRVVVETRRLEAVDLDLSERAGPPNEHQAAVAQARGPARGTGSEATTGVQMVELAVSDTGCGIPAANLQRIFDPFFTSKEVGKGTGLGLSVSYGIVKAHGGAIKVDSVVGEGSTFRVRLPTAPPFGEQADPLPASAEEASTAAERGLAK
jgi:two-component system NtrC family sensor kinase